MAEHEKTWLLYELFERLDRHELVFGRLRNHSCLSPPSAFQTPSISFLFRPPVACAANKDTMDNRTHFENAFRRTAEFGPPKLPPAVIPLWIPRKPHFELTIPK